MSGKSPLGLSKDPQSYEGLPIIVPPSGFTVAKAKRDPTSNDKKYPAPSFWLNTSSGALWYQAKNSVSWLELSAGSGAVDTLTGDSGGAIAPAGANITLAGTANQITTAGAGSTITFSLIGPYTPATYTAHGVLVGEGTSSITALAVGTTGQVLTGTSAADPAFAAIGTNSGLTAHGVLLGENNSAFVATAAGTNGQVLLGSTGADPAFGTITTSTGVAFTTGAASLAIDVKTGGFAVVNQTTGSVNLAAQTMYITNNATPGNLVTYTLPATVAQGSVIKIVGLSVGGWKIAQNAGQTISQNASVSTSGVNGSVSSSNKNNCVTLIATDATTNGWIIADSSGGALTIV